jgi:hypothetical protein
MSPGWRISPALLAAVAAAALSFGVCFAVVADATRTVAPDRVAARPARQSTPARLALTRAPSLRVSTNVLPPPAPPPAPVQAASPPPATSTTATTATTPEATTTQPTTTQPTTTQQTTTEQAPPPTTTQAPPPTTPKPKPKPKPKPQPSGPDFDDSGPQAPPG